MAPGRRSSRCAGVPLDIVTFGTPIRYGWDSAGYARLLHFINHRPAEGLPEYRAPFPPKLDDVLSAADGDYVQQLGIAGTNVMPSVFSWRSWLADHRLGRLAATRPLPPEAGSSDSGPARSCPTKARRCWSTTARSKASIAQHLAGHAVYTSSQWLLFHAEETVRRFYGEERGGER